MSKDPLLRGQPAPAGFASSVSGWLSAFVAQQRLENPSANMSVLARLNTLDGCSSAAVAAGDDDPRIRTLSVASPGPRWTPGPNQIAAVQGAGHKPGSISGVSGEVDDKLTGEKLLSALAHAAVLDIQTVHAKELSRLRKSPEAAALPEAVVAYERDRADNAERELRQVRIERETASADYKRERDHRRELQTVLRNSRLSPDEPSVFASPDADEERTERPMPEGIRKKGNGYQAYFKVAGKTYSKILPTVDEAVRWRRDTMDRAAAEQVAREANGPGPHYEPDVSPEERAAMQEQAEQRAAA